MTDEVASTNLESVNLKKNRKLIASPPFASSVSGLTKLKPKKTKIPKTTIVK